MQRLKDLLDSILSQTSFDVGSSRVEGQVTWTTFGQDSEYIVQPEQLRAAFARNNWDDAELERAKRAIPICPEEDFSHLTDVIRELLKEYVNLEKDSIGHSLPIGSTVHITAWPNYLVSTEYESSIDEFSKSLIKGAAVVGTGRVVDFLCGELQNRPFEYQTAYLLIGTVPELPIKLKYGIRIEPLPASSDRLPGHLPRSGGISALEYLGRAVLYIDTRVSPSLFLPHGDEEQKDKHASPVTDIDIETVCQALSLECSKRVAVGSAWNDYQDLTSLSRVDVGTVNTTSESIRQSRPYRISSTGLIELTDFKPPADRFDKESIEKTLDGLKNCEDRIRIAISRWMNSLQVGPRSLVDRFIDLRIALELMYLHQTGDDRYRGEMRFRLAIHGAWHLGCNPKNRTLVRKQLQAVYDAGSAAVHSGTLDGSPSNYTLLAIGQELCREGLLKLINEESNPDWGKLIMGFVRNGDEA